MLLDGLFIPVTTPFYADGNCYLKKLQHNVARYSRTPAAGMLLLGPWSEAEGLSDQERRESLRVAGETAAPDKVLIATAGAESVRGALMLAEWATQARFDAILLRAPLGWKALVRDGSLNQIELFFRAVADRAELPVLLGSDAAAAGFALPMEMIGELAGHPNVIGIADAGLTPDRQREMSLITGGVRREATVTPVFSAVTRRMRDVPAEAPGTFVSAESLGGGGNVAIAVAQAKPAIKTRTKSVGFQVIAAAAASKMLSLLQAGVAGTIPELAACAPQACYEVLAAFKDGDPELARLKAARLESAETVVGGLGVAGVKYACDLNGYYGGPPRLPRVGLTTEDRVRLENAMREVRN